MDPEFLSVLTLTIIDSTPIHKLAESDRFKMPSVESLMRELRTIVAEAKPRRRHPTTHPTTCPSEADYHVITKPSLR